MMVSLSLFDLTVLLGSGFLMQMTNAGVWERMRKIILWSLKIYLWLLNVELFHTLFSHIFFTIHTDNNILTFLFWENRNFRSAFSIHAFRHYHRCCFSIIQNSLWHSNRLTFANDCIYQKIGVMFVIGFYFIFYVCVFCFFFTLQKVALLWPGQLDDRITINFTWKGNETDRRFKKKNPTNEKEKWKTRMIYFPSNDER